MSTPTWVTLANANTYSQVGSATSVTGFTTGVEIAPGGSIGGLAYQTQPAQIYPGQMWRFTANGVWTSTGSPGLAIGIYYGGIAGSPLCVGSVAAASVVQNAASTPWAVQAMGRVIQPGTSAIWQVIGILSGIYAPGGTGGPGVAMMPAYTSNGQYDTSVAKIITLGASATAATGSISVINWSIEYMTEP